MFCASAITVPRTHPDCFTSCYGIPHTVTSSYTTIAVLTPVAAGHQRRGLSGLICSSAITVPSHPDIFSSYYGTPRMVTASRAGALRWLSAPSGIDKVCQGVTGTWLFSRQFPGMSVPATVPAHALGRGLCSKSDMPAYSVVVNIHCLSCSFASRRPWSLPLAMGINRKV